MKVSLKQLYTLLMVVLLGVFITPLLPEKYTMEATQAQSGIVVDIAENSSLESIANLLEKKKVISNAFAFKVLAYLTGNSRNLRRGTYKFQGDESMNSVLEQLKAGSELLIKVTIPEGLRKKQIYNLLRNSKLGNDGLYEEAENSPEVLEFIRQKFPTAKDVEGLLFPETYFFSKGISEQTILLTLVEHLLRRLPDSFFTDKHLNGLSPYQVLILASIIEKETGDESERGKISSVFHNRLINGYHLATDPTVIYGIKNFDGNLRKIHLKTPGPYNTYLNRGLTPTPISNPGLGAIQAALNPDKTSYLYFVAKGDGKSYFSKNLQEHNSAVKRYQLNRNKNYRSY